MLFYHVAIPVMTSQILKSVDFTKKQKSRYRERNIFSSNKNIHLLHIKGYFVSRNNFVVEIAFTPGVNLQLKAAILFRYV